MSGSMEALILFILGILPGVWAGDWGVSVLDQCVFRGTSVVIRCKYDYPAPHIVTSVNWFKRLYVSGQFKLFPLSSITSDPVHFRYLGNTWDDCTLQINNVQPSDEGEYYFSFKTTFDKWTSKKPTLLTVTELRAVVNPSTVTEGENVHLMCFSKCPVNIVWFRGAIVKSKVDFQANRADAGRYRCAVYGQETIRSTSVALNVQYAPSKVSLSASPSAIAVKGNSVTFTCSSEANPPVAQSKYSLFKDGQFIGSGSTHSVSDLQPSHSGRYSCQAWNNISRRGVDLFNSAEVQLHVQYRPMNISILMDPLDVIQGNSVNLTCSSSANPAAENYTWYKRTTSANSSSLLQVGSGPVLSLPSLQASHTGLYLCQAKNRLGENNSTEVMLSMRAERQGSLLLSVLAGVGIFLLVTLVFAFLLFWRKQKAQIEQTVFDVSVRGRGTSNLAIEDPPNTVYMNMGTFPSRQPGPAQDVSHQSKRKSPYNASTTQQDEVTYSTVTIKPRNSAHKNQRSNSDMKESWSTEGDNDTSVTYAAVVKTSRNL